jgi:hypothetical protein
MNLSKLLVPRYFACLVLCLSLFQLSELQAQVPTEAPTDTPTNDPHFKILASQSLGLTGFTTTIDFKLYDDSGFAYDAMSLLTNEEVKHSLNISREQSELIRESWLDSKKQMESIALSAITSEKKRNQVEALFWQSQESVFSHLEPSQIDNLDAVKSRLAIAQYGIANYLKTKHARAHLDLTDAQLLAIEEDDTAFKTNLSSGVKVLMREANLALIDELSKPEKARLEETLDEEALEKFLDSKLFLNQEQATADSPIATKTKNRAAIFNACLIRKIRSQANIDSDQYKRIRDFRKSAMEMDAEEFQSAVRNVMTSTQFDILASVAIDKEAKKIGTVNSISHGVLGEAINISEARAEHLFDFGKQLQQELLEDAKEMQELALADAFQTLSEKQVAHLAKFMEASDPLKFSQVR